MSAIVSPALAALTGEHAALVGRYNNGEGKDGVPGSRSTRRFLPTSLRNATRARSTTAKVTAG
jgi:hypothetical protein